MIICYFHIFMAMRKWILFLCNVSLMGLLFTFTWKLLDSSLILEHIGEGFSPLVALFWTWERAHRHLASVKSTCKIQYLFKWLMRMQQSVSVDNLEMIVWRQGGCTAWFVLFVTQPNYKMLLCPDTVLILGSLHLKRFCWSTVKRNIFFLVFTASEVLWFALVCSR